MSSVHKQKHSNLDKPLGKGKAEIKRQLAEVIDLIWKKFRYDQVNVATFALLFSEIVQYCQNRVYSVSELQTKLSDMGKHVGNHILDLLFVREKGYKRETKLLNMLLFIKNNFWKTLFGKEADRLEHSNDDERTYYIIETEHLVNRYISVPKDKGKLNCAAFTAGIIESVLNGANFPCKVTAHWHKGTTFMIEFDESVIARDKMVEGK